MTDGAELRDFLSGTSFFGGLPGPLVDKVMGLLKERQIAKGETLFEEGQSGNSMYIVRSGAILVERKCPHGTEARLLMMRKGDFFGVTALIEMEPRPFGASAEQGWLPYGPTNADLHALHREVLKG